MAQPRPRAPARTGLRLLRVPSRPRLGTGPLPPPTRFCSPGRRLGSPAFEKRVRRQGDADESQHCPPGLGPPSGEWRGGGASGSFRASRPAGRGPPRAQASRVAAASRPRGALVGAVPRLSPTHSAAGAKCVRRLSSAPDEARAQLCRGRISRRHTLARWLPSALAGAKRASGHGGTAQLHAPACQSPAATAGPGARLAAGAWGRLTSQSLAGGPGAWSSVCRRSQTLSAAGSQPRGESRRAGSRWLSCQNGAGKPRGPCGHSRPRVSCRPRLSPAPLGLRGSWHPPPQPQRFFPWPRSASVHPVLPANQ